MKAIVPSLSEPDAGCFFKTVYHFFSENAAALHVPTWPQNPNNQKRGGGSVDIRLPGLGTVTGAQGPDNCEPVWPSGKALGW